MGIIGNFVQGMREKKSKRANYEDDINMVKSHEAKEKSAYERELEKIWEKDRQEFIKQEVLKRQKEEDEKFWGGHMNNSADAPNIFANGKNIFKDVPHLFSGRARV